LLASGPLQIWTNHKVPPNDGGISLGQAALAAFECFHTVQQLDKPTTESSYA
jgi:hydrogenase maturation protein HypF